ARPRGLNEGGRVRTVCVPCARPAAACGGQNDRGRQQMTGTNTGWVRSWGASPQCAHDGLGSLDDHPPLTDVTLRQVVRLSGGGRRVRVRFTNEFGTAPVTIG